MNHYNNLNAKQKLIIKGYQIGYIAWKQTYLVDRRQIDSYSKDIAKLFPFSMTVAPWSDRLSKVLAQSEQSQLKLVKQQRGIFQKLSQIGFDINGFREQLKTFDQTHQCLVKIQNSSQNILGKLQHFREKMGSSYEQITDEEQKLKQQLQLLNKKIQFMGNEVYEQQKQNIKSSNNDVKIWQRQRQRKQEKIIASNKQDEQQQKLNIIEHKMKQVEKEINVIQKDINCLGKNLGWPEQDHNDFISIWHRGSSNKNYFQIEQQLQTYFAFYTGQQIQDHMNKYLKFRKLNQSKKQIIIKFKTLKQQKKIQQLRLLDLQRNKSKQEKQKYELKKKQQKQQIEMKQKIIQWKQLKLKQKKQEEEKKKQEQIQKQRQQALKRKEKVQLNKQKVQYWREKESQKQQELRRVQSARKQPAINKQVQERIRARQQQLVRKKIQIVNEKRRQEQLQKQKQVKVKQQKFIKYSHVSNKLDHKTTAMKQKQREKFDGKDRKQANTFGGQLIMTGVRATPNWMKGI